MFFQVSSSLALCSSARVNNFFLSNRTALAGLVTMLHACLDMKAIVLGKYHFVLYFLVLAMQVGSNLVLSLPLQIGSHFLISIHQPFMVNSFYLFIYFLLLQPRMFMAVDENNKALSVPVRVGQAVDVVGQAGRPKTITGFQTHSTPVLLAAGDRAELATEK